MGGPSSEQTIRMYEKRLHTWTLIIKQPERSGGGGVGGAGGGDPPTAPLPSLVRVEEKQGGNGERDAFSLSYTFFGSLGTTAATEPSGAFSRFTLNELDESCSAAHGLLLPRILDPPD